jgi:hypothetical protein
LSVAFKSLAKYPKHSLKEFKYLGVGIVSGAIIHRIPPAIIGMELPLSLVAAFSMVTMILVYVLLRRI